VIDGTGGAVLDASALLAYLRKEPGNESVEQMLVPRAVINAVNYAEVLARMSAAGEEPARLDRQLRDQGLIGELVDVLPLDAADAVTIACLRAATRAQGLSLGDRACLATALRFGRSVLTADRAWATVDVGVTVHVLRS
jgi:PIN domain nuclease of toxin-antitoxin system